MTTTRALAHPTMVIKSLLALQRADSTAEAVSLASERNAGGDVRLTTATFEALAPSSSRATLRAMGGDVSEQLRDCLRRFPEIRLAILFGSVAASDARADSDLDIAVSGAQTLTALERIELIEALALATGRAVDLVDLATVGEPLLGEILTGGVRILGTDEDHARLVTRHLIDAADFLPIRNRILAERRRAWIGK